MYRPGCRFECQRYHIRAFHYTISEKPQVVHIFGHENPHEERDKEYVEKIDERIRKKRSLLPDVVLVRPKEREREGEVKEIRGAGEKNEPAFRSPDVNSARQPGEQKRGKGVEGEKVGGKGDDEIRFCYGYAAPPVACVERLHRSPEQHGEERVRELVPEYIGEDRLFKEDVGCQVGETAEDKIVGRVPSVRNGRDDGRELDGEAQTERDKRRAERDFEDSVPHRAMISFPGGISRGDRCPTAFPSIPVLLRLSPVRSDT